jgi:NADPH:quinone reductase-like Zn-dependent oxidoreductase
MQTGAMQSALMPSTMKAVRIHGRGGPEFLKYEDAPIPRLAPGDVLLRVHATGITPTELGRDETYKNPDGSDRLPSIPGHEVSGVVQSLSPGVTDFREGQEVYGLADFTRDGAAAEYVAIRASNLAAKPKCVDHAGAAAASLSGLTVWQALFVHGNLSSGQNVLVHGAAGGVGVFAVQLARWRGARVSATADARDADFLRALGAHEVIDYKTERFEERLRDQDIVLDTISGETQDRSWQVLRKGGILINLSAPIPPEKPAKFGVRAVFFIVEPSRKMLTELGALIDDGAVKAIVSATFALSDARKAFEAARQHKAPGKMTLQVRQPVSS